MLVVMEAYASAEQIAHVCRVIAELGYLPHPMTSPTRSVIGISGNHGPISAVERLGQAPGVRQLIPITTPYKLASRAFHEADTVVAIGGTLIGGPAVTVIAGPCTVENRAQVLTIAHAVRAAGATILRGGAYKPRTSPYAFQGLAETGLRLLAEAREQTGLAIVTEVMDTETLPLVLEYADMLQIGARNMQNYSLLKAVGRTDRPVLLKRGFAATVQELLLAAEYILASGNSRVVLCERGIRTFDDSTRFTLDLGAVALLKQLSHLPVIVDPSHACGHADRVLPLARGAIAVGADGLIVEVHHDPASAVCDGEQALNEATFRLMMEQIARVAAAIDRPLLTLNAP